MKKLRSSQISADYIYFFSFDLVTIKINSNDKSKLTKKKKIIKPLEEGKPLRHILEKKIIIF